MEKQGGSELFTAANDAIRSDEYLEKDYIFLLKVKALLIKKGDAHCTDARGPTLKSMEEITLDTSGVLMLLLSTTKLDVSRQGDLLTLMAAGKQQGDSSTLFTESGVGGLF
nr:uncharacterized protein LOC131788199 [Pocillopora verrucosa]